MTRPGGVTPRGLPYPGSVNIHAETPKALQALAQTAESQLGSIIGGYQLRFWTGIAALDSTGSMTAVWPNFTVYGGIAQLSSHGGTTGKLGYCTAVQNGGKVTVLAANSGVKSTGPETFANNTVTMCVMAWGVPV
jgi:hypothetical protein